MRLERIKKAVVVLVTDTHINFIDEAGKRRFAYYKDVTEKGSPVKIFEDAIRRIRTVELFLERGNKTYDYIIGVTVNE